MQHSIRHYLGPIGAVLLLTACAGDKDRYPSLAIRDFERAQGQFTPAEPDDIDPVRPVASASDLASLVSMARETHTQFLAARNGAATLVGQARGQGIESNARQRALIALADLNSLRSSTAIALGDLDLLYAEAAVIFAPTEDIADAQSEVTALLEEQDGTLARLEGQIE